MKRTCEAIVLIVLATGVLAWAQGDAAMKVLADARAALGGTALAGVKTMTATGHATRMGTGDQVSTTDVEIAIERPDKFMRKEQMPAVMGTQITRTVGFNGAGLIDGIERGAPPANADPNMRVFAQTPLQAAPTPERAAEIAHAQLTKNFQEFSRFELGLFLDSLPAYPLTFTADGQASAPCGQADVIAVTGADDLTAKLYISSDSHRPACLAFMAKEPMAPMVMGNGMAVSSGGGLQVFAGGPAATSGRPQISVAGTLSPEMQAQIQAMQDQQAAAAAKRRTVEYRITYGDYKAFDGVQVPTRFKRFIDGKVVEEFVLDKVKINPRIDPSKFEVTRIGPARSGGTGIPGSGR
jgi:hypothetical protein